MNSNQTSTTAFFWNWLVGACCCVALLRPRPLECKKLAFEWVFCFLLCMLLKPIFLFLVLLCSCILVFEILSLVFLSYCWVDKPFCAFTARSRLPHIEMVMVFLSHKPLLKSRMPVNQRNGLVLAPNDHVSNDYGCSWWLSFLLNKIAWQSFAIYHFSFEGLTPNPLQKLMINILD